MPIVQEQPQPEDKPAVELNPRAVIGANEPPLEERIQMEFREALVSGKADFNLRMESAIAAVDRAVKLDGDGKVILVTEDEETLGKAGDLDNVLRACEGHISATHKTVKQPYLDGSRACDAEKNRLIDPITQARYRLKNAMNAYMAKREAERRAAQARAEAEQRAAQEAARRAEDEARQAEIAAARAAAQATSEEEREAAAQAARDAAAKAEEVIAAAPLAATVTRSEPVRSDAGATVSGRKVWQSEVLDYDRAFQAVRTNPKVREAIDKAVAQLVKAGMTEIDGVRTWQAVTAVSR